METHPYLYVLLCAAPQAKGSTLRPPVARTARARKCVAVAIDPLLPHAPCVLKCAHLHADGLVESSVAARICVDPHAQEGASAGRCGVWCARAPHFQTMYGRYVAAAYIYIYEYTLTS